MEEIVLNKKGDISKIMAPDQEKQQSLAGFDADYIDIVDYIVRSTHKIWEEGGLGLINGHYQHNVAIWTSDGLTYGREKVIADSTQMMAAFPDCRLIGDEVIWTGDDKAGFHTSHRIYWIGRNTGYSKYGPPTGKRIVRYGIANCFVRENRVVEEWIARDEASLVLQLGLDIHETARRMAAAEAAQSIGKAAQGEIERVQGETTPEPFTPAHPGSFDIEDFIRQSHHEIWNWRLLNKVRDTYAPNFQCHTAAGRELYGRGAYRGFILSLLAAFPDAALTVDHVYWMGNEQEGYKVATRWTLVGTHLGPGIYGAPTGKRIRILGITHHRVQGGKIQEEWLLFDEFALLKQIYRPE